jgi:ProP effector
MTHDQTEKNLIEKLASVYPRTFFRNQADRRPLKIGVHHALVADTSRHGLSRDELRKALARYCSSPGYAAATVLNAPRIDLAGEPAGLVTAEATAAAVKAARLSQKTRREQRETKVEEKAVAAAPEQQTEKAVAPRDDLKNGNAIKLSLADLRVAATYRQNRSQT